MPDSAFVHCMEVGCRNGIDVHWRHLANMRDSYICPEHCVDDDEVPP